MSAASMFIMLMSIKLFVMAGAIDALVEQGAPAWTQSVSVPEGLIKAEVGEREVRSVNCQMKVARYPAHRYLAGFDFKENAVKEALVRTRHRGEHIDTETRCSNSASTENQNCR
jgi:IstB-like ATP binding protein